MDKVFQVTQFGPDHRLEYFMRNGDTWVRETSKGRTLEMTLTTYLLQDPSELALSFAVGVNRLSRNSGIAEVDPGT